MTQKGGDSMKRSIFVESISQFQIFQGEPGFVLPGEALADHTLIQVRRGRLHSVADGRDLDLGPGDLVYYRPGQWHMQYADVEVSPTLSILRFRSDSPCLGALAGQLLPVTPAVTALLEALDREIEPRDDHSPGFLLATLELLLLHLVRELGLPTQAPKALGALHGENEIIRRAQQYVSAHVRDRLTVPQVAGKVDVSPSYLTALFQKHLNITPGEYIRRIKLQESKRLIREGSLNFTQIAAALSYSTVHQFSRQFKEKFGMTPTEYAKSVRP